MSHTNRVNPFVHGFHPDHDNLDFPNGVRTEKDGSADGTGDYESWSVARQVAFAFAAEDPAGPNPRWNVTETGGVYTETVAGLGKTEIKTSGAFRLSKVSDASGDTAWRDVLQGAWRANLRDMPEFQRYCLPFSPMAAVEPGFAIPFSSTISFRKNFFGQDLDAGDNAFDSTYFATKVRGVGIWFQGYSSAVETGLANRPQVYIVPAGVDFMRVPIQAVGAAAATRGWQVLDQVLPLPYPLADSQWETADWSALKNLCGNELMALRKYPSIRAFHDSGYSPDQMSYNARLVGRSVWNNQWWIIIPAGSLHADDETARTRFLDQVKDIKLYLKTYSFSGN